MTDSSSQDQQSLGTGKSAAYRYVYDARQQWITPGTLVRSEGQPPVKDHAVNEAYDNAGIVLKFYKDLFDWDSVDNKNMDIIQTVHYGFKYQNAGKVIVC